MKKIAFVTLNDHAPWGGSEVFWTELAKLFNKDNFTTAVSVAHWPDEPHHIAELRSHGSEIYYRYPKEELGKLKFYQRLANRFLPGRFFFRPKLIPQPQKYYDVINLFQPDLVFISVGDHLLGGDWMMRLQEKGIPYIIINQLVKDYVWMAINSKRFTNLKNGYLGAKKVLFTSYDNERIMAKYFFTHFTNAEVINNPIKKPEAPITYPKQDVYRFANVAHLGVDHKGQDVLLEVIASPKWQNRNVEFNFYGKGTSELLMHKLIEYWGIKNVKFNAFAKIEQIWNDNHILLMPSKYEGLSLAFLEAMNCKRSAVISNLGDASRFIEDNVNGFIIKACVVELVDEALERAWERREAWEAMGIKAHDKLNSIIKEDPLLSFYNSFKKELDKESSLKSN